MKPVTNRELPEVLRRIRREVRGFKVPVVGQFAADPFETLVSTVLSLRTQDATTEAASRRLFALADGPRALFAMSEAEIRRAIYPVSFYRNKARHLREIARLLIEKHGGKVPSTIDELVEMPGVGRKTANLVVTLSFRKPGICVDTHVHRIVNRWGYVKTKSADETEQALREVLPERYWIGLNDWLVAWGQNVCRPLSPWCGTCPVSDLCPRLGVDVSR